VPDYSISELAQLADVSVRTIRFYIEQGLLPAPDPAGRKTRYTDEHLERIRAIRKLQAAHFPLAEIRSRLDSLTPDELSTIADLVQPRLAQESAVDYIRSVLEPTGQSTPPPQPTYSMPTPRLTMARAASAAMREDEGPLPSMPAPAAPAKPSSQPTETTQSTMRSQWERIALDPDVELHVRRPLTRHGNKRVERLIAIARELFKEED